MSNSLIIIFFILYHMGLKQMFFLQLNTLNYNVVSYLGAETNVK